MSGASATSTTVVVAADVGEPLPDSLTDAELVRERRARRMLSYPGPERRVRPAPRLEAQGAGLAVVHTCSDCGRVSIVPYVPGAALTAGSPCVCAAIGTPAAAMLTPAFAPVAPLAAPARRGRALVVTFALVALWVLNLEDVILTRRALALGAIEMNTIMGFFLRFGFAQAALIKMSIVTVGSIFLWTQRRRGIVLLASLGLAAIYVALVIYQIVELAG